MQYVPEEGFSTTAHLRKIDGELVLALDEATVADLALAEGDTFGIELREGVVVLRPSSDHGERLARGRANTAPA